ncbi:MAG: hypothetical protein KIH08_16880 [Candidatus Freyarchaeota archaeon]|nr:hypothetical protein [Candidatus Jordarchaeia archaeon]
MEKLKSALLTAILLLPVCFTFSSSVPSIPSELWFGLRNGEETNSITKVSQVENVEFTNPFPLYDNLTESPMIGWGPYGEEPALPNKGYWELKVPGWGVIWDRWTSLGTVAGKSTTKCIGDYSVGSQVAFGSNPDRFWIPNCIYYDFEFVLDVTQWHYFKFYLWLGPGATGYGEFGLKDVNGKFATIQYGPLPLQQWLPMGADIWDQSKWGYIESGFNWSAVAGFGVYASNWWGPSEALIDSPLFYTGPNDLPHGKISAVETETNYSRLFVELYYLASATVNQKDYDVYVIHASFRNKVASPTLFLPFLKIIMAMEDVASEYGNTEKPQAGYYDYQTMMTFGISIPPFSISFPITLPQLEIDFSASSFTPGIYKFEWVCKDPWRVSRNVIKRNTYGDFVVAIKVPVGFKPYITVMAEAQWYMYNPVRDVFVKWTTEQVGWLVVDPPEATQINPTTPDPEPLPAEAPVKARIKEIKVRGCNFATNPAFAFGSFGWSLSGGAEITNTVYQIGYSSVLLPPPFGAIRQSFAPYRYADEIILECSVYASVENQQIGITLEYQGGATMRTYALTTGWNKIQFDPLPHHSKVTGIYVAVPSTNTDPIYLDYVDIYQYKNFKRDDWVEIWLEISWYIPDKPLSISVEITDSSGKTIDMWALLASRYVQGDSWCGFGGSIISRAEIGTVEVRARLWTNWKWESTADQYGWDVVQNFDIVG